MKMRSYVRKVGFNPEWPMSLWEEKTETQTQIQTECHVTTEGKIGTMMNLQAKNAKDWWQHQKLRERHRTHSLLESSERRWPDDTWFWTGVQNRERISVLFSKTPVCGAFYGSPTFGGGDILIVNIQVGMSGLAIDSIGVYLERGLRAWYTLTILTSVIQLKHHQFWRGKWVKRELKVKRFGFFF